MIILPLPETHTGAPPPMPHPLYSLSAKTTKRVYSGTE